MKRQRVLRGVSGFTLVELLVTVAIIIIMASLATVQFNSMTLKASIEKELKMLYADLMELRLNALYEKVPRAAKFTSQEFSIYPEDDIDSSPIKTRTLPHAVAWSGGGSSLVLRYDTYGISNDAVTVCLEPDRENPASVDSIVISKTRIRMGKRIAASCASTSIDLK